MKKLTYLLTASVLLMVLTIVGCKKDDDPGVSPTDEVGNRLAGTWTINESTPNSVKFEQEDRTDNYSDFTLTFTYSEDSQGGNYTTSGGPEEPGANPFPGSGTWEFVNEITDPSKSFQIKRDDGLVITVSSLTDSKLSFTFDFDSSNHSGSRVEAVDGTWSFIMEK